MLSWSWNQWMLSWSCWETNWNRGWSWHIFLAQTFFEVGYWRIEWKKSSVEKSVLDDSSGYFLERLHKGFCEVFLRDWKFLMFPNAEFLSPKWFHAAKNGNVSWLANVCWVRVQINQFNSEFCRFLWRFQTNVTGMIVNKKYDWQLDLFFIELLRETIKKEAKSSRFHPTWCSGCIICLLMRKCFVNLLRNYFLREKNKQFHSFSVCRKRCHDCETELLVFCDPIQVPIGDRTFGADGKNLNMLSSALKILVMLLSASRKSGRLAT